MPSSPKVRVAVVGAGYFSQYHYDAWSRLPEATLAAACDRDPQRLAAKARAFKIERTYADAATMIAAASPDLLDIVTPPETHAELVALACDRCIDAICQKPLAPSAGEAEAIAARAEAAGIRLVVHENFRFMPWFAEAKRLAETGEFGEIYALQFRLRPGDGQGPEAYLQRQPYFRKMPRFLIHETGIHFIDTFRFLLGEPTAVCASLQRRNPAIVGEDSGYALFEFEGGRRALLDANRLVGHPAANPRLTMGEFLLEGSAGRLRLDGEGRLWRHQIGESEERPHAYAWDGRNFGGDCVYRCQKAILEALQAGRSPPNIARDYLRNISVEEGLYRSSQTGCRVEV